MHQPASAAAASAPPLCVALNGSVLRTDLLVESVLSLVKRDILFLFTALFWLLRGKAALKAEVARRIDLDPAALPYNQHVIAWLKEERARGREIWLCTAENRQLAERVAGHLALFDGVLASDEHVNLRGRSKAEALVRRFGLRAFDYCGTEWRDVPIWNCSGRAIVVGRVHAFGQPAPSKAPVVRQFPESRSRWRLLARAIRLHQWAKNILVFVPMLTSHRAAEWPVIFDATLAFLAFCFCASSVYVLNDMLDLEADRTHARKSKRPFAAGDLPIAFGVWLVPLLLAGAAVIAGFLPRSFQVALGVYYVLTLAYSFRLKAMMLIDTTALAGLYTLRIVAGAAAIAVPLSFWLLLFSVFFFLSLAFVKRYAELDALRRSRRLTSAGRSYSVEDLPILLAFGISGGFLSVLVLALYINSPAVSTLYGRPEAIWASCVLLLFWISRVWMKAHRGEMNEDPVLFALRDRVSLGIGVLAAITLGVAM